MKVTILYFVLTALSTVSVTAGPIFSNFGPGDSYGSTAMGVTPGFTRGYDFILTGNPGQQYTLTGIELAIWLLPIFAGPNPKLGIRLMGDSAGAPDPAMVLEDFVLTGVAAYPHILSVTSTGYPILAAGKTYWFMLGPPSPMDMQALWFENSIGDYGRTATLETAYAGGPVPRGAMRISGEVISAANPDPRGEVISADNPEPGTYALLAIGLLALIAVSRIYRRAA